MKIHRVLALPALTGLNPGDLYNVKASTESVVRLWKVDNTGVPRFVTGLTQEQEVLVDQLSQEMIDKLTLLGDAIYVGEDTPDNKEYVWVDVSDTAPSPQDESDVVAALRAQIDILTGRLNDVEYRFDFNMDSGDFNNKAGEEQFANYVDIEPGSPEDPTFNPDNPDYNPMSLLAADDEEDPERPEDGWPLDVEDGEDPELEPKDSNIKHLRIKRGNYITFKADSLQDGELGYIKDRNLLYIGNNGIPKLIGSGSGGGGGGTIDGPVPFLDYQVENMPGLVYRTKVNSNGDMEIYNAAIDTAADHQVANPGNQELIGLYISMFYAGGESESESTNNVCSHNFIEIYNRTGDDINLKGLSLQYSKIGTDWKSFPLKGIIPAQTAFTVRGARCAPKGLNTILVDIDSYDMEWESLRIPLNGVKLYLTVGTQPCTEINPSYTRGAALTFLDGYIDLVGIGGISISDHIDGYETAFPNLLTAKRAIHRVYFADYNQRPAGERWGDTNNNKSDFTYIEYDKSLWVDNTKVYKPWSTKDGVKDLYFDKNSWNPNKPNMVTNSFGRNAHITRTFNWISVGYYDEHLQYRMKGSPDWITIESIKNETSLYKRRLVKGFNGVWFTVHKQIITDLLPGTYEFKVGRLDSETYWSDILEFTMVALGQEDDFGFVMTADQQAWSWKEYEPWRIASEHAYKWENDLDPTYPATGTKDIAFHLNVGDMTENGIRPHEWLYYYEAGKSLNHNYAQMNVVGNNDLCPEPGETIGKINPESFDWFYTYEHNPDNIPMYRGETMKSVYSFDYGNMHFVVVNTNNYIEEQKAWFIADMQEVHSRAVKPRWIVVSMHDACFNIITDADPKRDTGFNQRGLETTNPQGMYSWSRLYEEWGVHLVLSGHKHTYARSKPVLEKVGVDGIVDPLNPIVQVLSNPQNGETVVPEYTGVVYLMSQATGSKLDSNKDVPAQAIVWNDKWFPGEGGKSSGAQRYPTYIKLDVSQDKITHHSYQVKNIMPNTSYSYDPYNPIVLPKERILIDTSEVTKKWKNITI